MGGGGGGGGRVGACAYRGIGALAELLELLEAAGVAPRVHGVRDGLAVAERAHGNGGLGAEGDRDSAGDGGLEAAGRRAVGVLPEFGARGGDLAGDAQERGRRCWRCRRGRAVWGGGSGRRGEGWWLAMGERRGGGANGLDQRQTAVWWGRAPGT